MPLTTLRLLGTIEFHGAHNPDASLYQPKKVAALAYLLLMNGSVRRGQLATLLWPESDERRARRSLNQLLLELRRDHGKECITNRGDDDLVLNRDTFSCDVTDLLIAAERGDHKTVVELYRGELMPGFIAPGANDYNDWLERQRERVRMIVADSLWELAKLAPAEQVKATLLKRCFALRPMDENVLRRLMNVLHDAHNSAEAIAYYETFRATLRAELGTAPSRTTTDLATSIASDDRVPSSKVEPVSTTVAAEPLSTTVRSGSVPRRSRFRVAAAIAAIAVCIVAGYKLASSVNADQPGKPIFEIHEFTSSNTSDSTSAAALPDLLAAQVSRTFDTHVVHQQPHNRAALDVLGSITNDGDVYVGKIEVRSTRGAVVKTFDINSPVRLGLDSAASQASQRIRQWWYTDHPQTRNDRLLDQAKSELSAAEMADNEGASPNLFEMQMRIAETTLDSIATKSRTYDWYKLKAQMLSARAWQLHHTGNDRAAADAVGEAAAIMRRQGTHEAIEKAAYYRNTEWVFDFTRQSVFMDSSEAELTGWLKDNPNSPGLWREMSQLNYAKGRYVDAEVAAEKARHIDPTWFDDPGTSLMIFVTAFNARMDQTAIAECDRIRHNFKSSWPAGACTALTAGFAGAEYSLDLPHGFDISNDPAQMRATIAPRLTALLAAAHARHGQMELAKRELRSVTLTDDIDLQACVAVALYATGDVARATAIREALAHRARNRAFLMYHRVFEDLDAEAKARSKD